MKEYVCAACGLHFFVADDDNPDKCQGCESIDIQEVSEE